MLSFTIIRMRAFLGLVLIVWCSRALALDNNQLETWSSPNGKYAVREKFYGEGKRVLGIFVNRSTGKTAPTYPHGARDLSALWSPDSHFVVMNAELGHYADCAALYRVVHGKIAEIALPANMEASQYLSPRAKEGLTRSGHLSFESIRAVRWHDDSQVEFVSETEACLPDGMENELVSQHFILKVSRGEAKIIKTFRETEA